MSTLPSANENRSALQVIMQWCRDLVRADPMSQLSRCGEKEVERIAKDIRLSASELRAVVGHGPEAVDLLLRRMATLDLDPMEVSEVGPQTFRDLRRVCTMCESKRRCMRDLARDPARQVWEEYCPNTATLMALDALPWSSRREW